MAALTGVTAAEVMKSGQTLVVVGRQQHSVCRQGDEGRRRQGLPWPGLPLGKDGAACPEMLRLGWECLWSAGKVERSVLDLGV